MTAGGAAYLSAHELKGDTSWRAGPDRWVLSTHRPDRPEQVEIPGAYGYRALVDDLDYEQRGDLALERRRLAIDTCRLRRGGVFVADRPEWKKRTERVPPSWPGVFGDMEAWLEGVGVFLTPHACAVRVGASA